MAAAPFLGTEDNKQQSAANPVRPPPQLDIDTMKTRRAKNQNESLQNMADETNTWSYNDISNANGKGKNGDAPPPASSRTNARTTRATSARTTKRGGKKSTSQPTLMSDPHLIQAMEEARYEAFIDPYRGIVPFFSLCSGNIYDETPSPWVKCADVLDEKCTSYSFKVGGEEEGKMEVVNVDDEDDGSNKQTKNNDGEESAVVVHCGCPTVDKWANDELEVYNKQKAAAAKKKKAGKGGKKRKKSGDSVAKPDEVEDDVMIVDDENKAPENTITNGMHFICGERKSDPKICHPCDYNPFCLASLGGIVDQYRHSAAKVSYDIANTKSNNKQSQTVLSQLIHDNMATCFTSSSQNADGRGDKNNDKDGDLRRSILVDHDAIQSHISRFICDGEHDTATCLQQIQSVHEPLVFRPKSDQIIPNENGKMELSMPSGLRNLGATCYLNSQLQCLAQNLGFVHGLFSWRRPSIDSGSEMDKRMSTVLSNMQSILARMRYGPDRVLCTNEFASALNLENDEMQDPNEFARLLFDRMLDSFRRSAELSLGTEQQNGLGELLPSVFGGTSKYITQCSECANTSNRTENFMELSVPIVDCKEGSSGQQCGKAKQANKSKMIDVDVQFCVNSYLRPESLDGDNQYECSTCKKKCDATRRMEFAKLPPVLNIQLARYVFDRETLSKRKLTTKVLLPKSLEIPGSSTNKRARYLLCSVQNHLGNSAHGGHYVADVMDWATGTWYEFNDENVAILEDGPKSSFDPSEIDNNGELKQNGKQCKVSGSADAYNLFYVEQSYLSKHCKNEFRHFMEIEASPVPNILSGNIVDILASVKVQRRERYCRELEIQTKNEHKDRRVCARREQIMKSFFLPSSKLKIQTNSEGKKIWVDSDFLKRFFSCQDGMDDIFRSALESSTILRRQSFLCDHSIGLHPREACQGKLLPSDVYNELETIMRNEYAMFLRDQDSDTSTSAQLSLFDHKFVDGKNLHCQDCGLSYRQCARDKYDLFKTLVSIHDDLIPGNNDLDPSAPFDPSSVYVISRTFVTSFRKYVEKKVTELKNMPSKKSSDKAKSTMSCGGIDFLDLSEAMDNNKATKNDVDQGSVNLTENSDPFKGEDPTSKISCHHKCCPLMHKCRSVRLISVDVWQKLVKVFPGAIPHELERPRDNVSMVGNCEQCHLEKEEEIIFPQKLDEWKCSITQPGGPLSYLIKRGKQSNEFYPSEIDTCLHVQQDLLNLRVLHHIDLQRWRDSINVIEKWMKSRKKNDAVKMQLNELLFAPSEASPLGRELKFRILTCKEHQKAVGLPSFHDDEDVKSWLAKLDGTIVELLLEDEYKELISSLSTLDSILNGSESAPLFEESQPPTVSLRFQKGTPCITMDPQPCTFDCGVTSFNDESIQNGTIVSKPKQPGRSKQVSAIELIVESPKGPLCNALVHDLDIGVNIDVAATQILLDISNDSVPPPDGRPRRSRKARGRGGGGGFPVHEIEMALDGNLAHFRLLLHQSKSKKLFGQRLFLLRTGSSDSENRAEELTPGICNHKTIHEILGAPSNNGVINEEQKDCTIHFILSYNCSDSSNSDGTRRNTRKRLSQEEKEEENSLLACLAEIACGGWKTADDCDAVTKGKASKRRRQERGFQGTFLQSTSEVDAPASPPLPQNNELLQTSNHDESGSVVIVDTPQKALTANDTDVASTNSNDECRDLEQRVDEEIKKALLDIQDCTKSLSQVIKKRILSTINANPDESPAVSTVVREALAQNINARLKRTPNKSLSGNV